MCLGRVQVVLGKGKGVCLPFLCACCTQWIKVLQPVLGCWELPFAGLLIVHGISFPQPYIAVISWRCSRCSCYILAYLPDMRIMITKLNHNLDLNYLGPPEVSSFLTSFNVKILISLVAIARMWKGLSKFGASTISWTGSVMVIRVSACIIHGVLAVVKTLIRAVMAHACNPSNQEAEAGVSLRPAWSTNRVSRQTDLLRRET